MKALHLIKLFFIKKLSIPLIAIFFLPIISCMEQEITLPGEQEITLPGNEIETAKGGNSSAQGGNNAGCTTQADFVVSDEAPLAVVLNTTFPLWMYVRTFLSFSDSRSFRSSAIGKILYPPTLMPRKSAIQVSIDVLVSNVIGIMFRPDGLAQQGPAAGA